MFHLGLSGVSEFLWYRAGDEWPTEGIADFSDVLAEVDAVVGQPVVPGDAHCLKQLVSFGDGTLLSGIRARDGSVFRLSVREPATVLSKSPATFRLANGSSVVPVAGGTLVELPSTAAGTQHGYWIMIATANAGGVCG